MTAVSAKAARVNAAQNVSVTQSSTAMLLRHLVLRMGNQPPLLMIWGKERLADGITSFLRRIALADGGHAVGGVGTLGKLAEPILAVRSVPAAAPALRVRPLHAAVIVVAAGFPLHETFKSPMIAMGKIHGIPPFKGQIWASRYI